MGGRGVLSIALAAWVRQLPLWLLKSLVVTECLQSGHLKVLKPLIIVMVQYLRPSSVVALKLPSDLFTQTDSRPHLDSPAKE